VLKGHSVESKEISTVSLMREMNWTYEEYMNQPIWVVQTLSTMLREEYYHNKRKK